MTRDILPGHEGVIPEDFGRVVMISRKPFMLWLACSNTDGSTTEWTAYPVAELPVLQRLFNPVDPAPGIERLSVHLAELVPSIPGVTDIVWEWPSPLRQPSGHRLVTKRSDASPALLFLCTGF